MRRYMYAREKKKISLIRERSTNSECKGTSYIAS